MRRSRGPRRSARRRARRARRAGAAQLAGDDRGKAPAIFVAVDAKLREGAAPERRNVGGSARLDCREAACADPDLGDQRPSAMQPARQQQMPGLQPEKGHRHISLDRGAADGTSLPSMPEGTSTATTDAGRRGATVDRLDGLACETVEVARQAGAEQRVDDEVGAGDEGPGALAERRHGAGPAARRFGGVAAEPVGIGKRGDRDAEAALAQAGGDEAVAAIVAGAAAETMRSASGPSSAAAASATARPAFSMRTIPGVPAAMVSRSASAISSVVSSSRKPSSLMPAPSR